MFWSELCKRRSMSYSCDWIYLWLEWFADVRECFHTQWCQSQSSYKSESSYSWRRKSRRWLKIRCYCWQTQSWIVTWISRSAYMNRRNKDIARHSDWLVRFDHRFKDDRWWTIEEKCSVICKETFKEWRWTENLDWIQWSLINHEFNILIEATFQLSFQLWYLHHQWCKKYNAFLSTICRWQSK